jgi:hypothetical protein
MKKITDLLDIIQDNAMRSFLGKDFAIVQIVFQDCDRLDSALKDLRLSIKSTPNLLHLAETIGKIARCERDVADLVSPMIPP